jgi:hypothetical protein
LLELDKDDEFSLIELVDSLLELAELKDEEDDDINSDEEEESSLMNLIIERPQGGFEIGLKLLNTSDEIMLFPSLFKRYKLPLLSTK